MFFRGLCSFLIPIGLLAQENAIVSPDELSKEAKEKVEKIHSALFEVLPHREIPEIQLKLVCTNEEWLQENFEKLKNNLIQHARILNLSLGNPGPREMFIHIKKLDGLSSAVIDGHAQFEKESYVMMVFPESLKSSSLATELHELTHIWFGKYIQNALAKKEDFYSDVIALEDYTEFAGRVVMVAKNNWAEEFEKRGFSVETLKRSAILRDAMETADDSAISLQDLLEESVSELISDFGAILILDDPAAVKNLGFAAKEMDLMYHYNFNQRDYDQPQNEWLASATINLKRALLHSPHFDIFQRVDQVVNSFKKDFQCPPNLETIKSFWSNATLQPEPTYADGHFLLSNAGKALYQKHRADLKTDEGKAKLLRAMADGFVELYKDFKNKESPDSMTVAEFNRLYLEAVEKKYQP